MTELEYKKDIYEKADKVTDEQQLGELLNEIKEFTHDYGTIVYGCMAAMKAAFNVVNKSSQGGITVFQAGCLGWECVHKFMDIQYPCKIVDFNNMLYPQYENKFEKIISHDAWDDLQKKAIENLAKDCKKESPASNRVRSHWLSIAGGNIPFGYRLED